MAGACAATLSLAHIQAFRVPHFNIHLQASIIPHIFAQAHRLRNRLLYRTQRQTASGLRACVCMDRINTIFAAYGRARLML